MGPFSLVGSRFKPQVFIETSEHQLFGRSVANAGQIILETGQSNADLLHFTTEFIQM